MLFCRFKAVNLLMTNNLQGHQQREEGERMYQSQRRKRKAKRRRKNQKRR